MNNTIDNKHFNWQHIEFIDGSNPYICKDEKNFKWMQENYKLEKLSEGFWRAYSKYTISDPFTCPVCHGDLLHYKTEINEENNMQKSHWNCWRCGRKGHAIYDVNRNLFAGHKY